MSAPSHNNRPRGPKGPKHPRPSTPADRVEWLLNTVWHGNQSQMARDVACGASVISKIIMRQQSAGARVLTRIASYPGINPGWLLSGEGEPFLAEKPATAGALVLPTARALLPGPPELHRGLLSGDTFPAAAQDHRSTRYWLQLQENDPILRSREQSMLAGDLLLMETDVNYRNTIELVDGQICAVRVRDRLNRQAKALKLALVTHNHLPDEESLSADTFECEGDPTKIERRLVLRIEEESLEVSSSSYEFYYHDEQGRTQVLKRVPRFESIMYSIQLDEIVAVCLHLVRRQPGA